MNTLVSKNRWLVKRLTVPGQVPTLPPATAVTSQYYLDNTWLGNPEYTMIGELCANVADGKIWLTVGEGNNILLGAMSGLTNIVDLGDVDLTTLTGHSDEILVINSGGTAVTSTPISTFYNVWTGNSFTNLIDCPSTLNGYSGMTLVVSPDEGSLVFSAYTNNLTACTDVNSSYDSGIILVANGSGFTGVDGGDVFVALTGTQVVNGAKTFNDIPVMAGGISIAGAIDFEGNIDIVTIENINKSFSTYSHSTLATSQAIAEYIDEQIFTTGNTANFVTINTPQTITSEKTFTADTNFNAINVSGNANFALDTVNYFGDNTTEGSYRERINEDGDFVLEYRNATEWVVMNNSSYSTNLFISGTGLNAIMANNREDSTASGTCAINLGLNSHATGDYSLATGVETVADGEASTAQGSDTAAYGFASHSTGIGTIASGTCSYAGGGQTSAFSNYSRATGLNSQTRLITQHAEAAGKMIFPGSPEIDYNQYSRITFSNISSDTTPTNLLINGSGFTIAEDSFVKCKGILMGTDYQDMSDFEFSFSVKNVGGTTSIVGTPSITAGSTEISPVYFGITANDSTDSVELSVTGKSATIIAWQGFIEMVEIKFI